MEILRIEMRMEIFACMCPAAQICNVINREISVSGGRGVPFWSDVRSEPNPGERFRGNGRRPMVTRMLALTFTGLLHGHRRKQINDYPEPTASRIIYGPVVVGEPGPICSPFELFDDN